MNKMDRKAFSDSAFETGKSSRKKGKSKVKAYTRNPTHPRTETQAELLQALRTKTLIAYTGAAGTGKTRIACAAAVEALDSGRVSRIILCRPAVEAGESLGFLPGKLQEKIAPYMIPVIDELAEIMGPSEVERLINAKIIEIVPLAFMRGRTLKDSFILGDEMQNGTHSQIMMFLTRLGEGSIMAFSGDPTQQNDLPRGKSGLAEAIERLRKINSPDIAIFDFPDSEIVRHPVVKQIVSGFSGYGQPQPS